MCAHNSDLQSSSAEDRSGVPAHVLARQDSADPSAPVAGQRPAHGGGGGGGFRIVVAGGTAHVSSSCCDEAQHHHDDDDDDDARAHAHANENVDVVLASRAWRRRQLRTHRSPNACPSEAKKKNKSKDEAAPSVYRARTAAVAVVTASLSLLLCVLLLRTCGCHARDLAAAGQSSLSVNKRVRSAALALLKGGSSRDAADSVTPRGRSLQSPASSPTDSPTVSPAPTVSPEPTVSPTMEPTADPDSSTTEPVPTPTTDDGSPDITSPVQTPAPVSISQPVTLPTSPPVAPVAPPPTGFPTLVVYTDSPTDEPVAGTFPPSTDRPSSSFLGTADPTPSPVSSSTLLPTSSSTTAEPTADLTADPTADLTADPTAAPTTAETQAIATYNPSPYPTPGSENVPVPVPLSTAAPVERTPAPIVNIPWTPPPANPPDPTPAPVDNVPWTPPPDGNPFPTSPPDEETSDPTSEPTLEPPTTDDSGPEGTAAPQAPTPRPAAPTQPSDPAPADPTPRPVRPPTRSPSRPASEPAAEPTDRPQRAPQDDGGEGGVRPSPTDEPPSENLAQRPSPAPSTTVAPTPKDENSATAPVTAPTAALGYSYDMVRVGREGLEMSIALSQASQRRLGAGLSLTFLRQWSAPPRRRRSLQQGGGIQDAALCTEVWAKYMEDIIRFSVNQAIRSVELVDVEIQNVALDRKLDEAALMFFFDVQIRIRSPPTDHNVDTYVSAPFDTDQEKQIMVDYLRNSDCKEFKYATSVTLILPPSSNSVESYSSRPANTGLIVGIAAAAVAFAMLVALFAYMKIKARRSYRYQEEEKALAVLQEQPTHDYASEIGMRTSADISTLSDPVPLGAVAPASRDGSTAGSFTLDYDFQKACQASVSEMSGGSHHETASRDYFSTDDGSLEAQYVADEQVEVVAPAGVLGLILETNEDGIPVVNNVKASSVLTGQVHVGDRLLSVDGQDVTVMLASDVSKLIAFKKHKPERRLVFARSTRGRNHSHKESLLNEVDANQDQASWMQGSTRSR